MVRGTRGLTVLLNVLFVVLAGCTTTTPTNPAPRSDGPAPQHKFEADFTGRFGQYIERFDLQADDSVPYFGLMTAQLFLRSDTPAATVEEILTAMQSWQTTAGVYRPSGVVANGVGICLEDPQREARRQLRNALAERSEALVGQWPCRGPQPGTFAPYRASLDDFIADTERVRKALATFSPKPSLRVNAEFDAEAGRADLTWSDPPDKAFDALRAVREREPIRQVELTDNRAVLAVQPSLQLLSLQTLADEAAGAGPRVEVVQGSLDEAERPAYQALAPHRADWLKIPGVTAVAFASPTKAVLCVPDEAGVAAAVRTLLSDGLTRSLTIRVDVATVPTVSQPAAKSYERPAGATSDTLDAFGTLATDAGLTGVRVTEAANPPQGTTALLRTDRTDLGQVVPHVKQALSPGAWTELAWPSGRVGFYASTQLIPDQVKDAEGITAAAFAELWNRG